MADPGEAPRGPTFPPLIFSPNCTLKGRKKYFLRRPSPHLLSEGMDPTLLRAKLVPRGMRLTEDMKKQIVRTPLPSLQRQYLGFIDLQWSGQHKVDVEQETCVTREVRFLCLQFPSAHVLCACLKNTSKQCEPILGGEKCKSEF